jgi:hypothetical protein
MFHVLLSPFILGCIYFQCHSAGELGEALFCLEDGADALYYYYFVLGCHQALYSLVLELEYRSLRKDTIVGLLGLSEAY